MVTHVDHREPAPFEELPDIRVYPEGEHQPMPSFAHELAMHLVREQLTTLLAPASLVATEMAVLFNPANRRDYLQPDLLVALGKGELDPVYHVLRRQYRIWDEQGPPDLVVEAASPTTVGRDKVGKKEDYASMGVREYVQFDPLGELLRPGLQVYHLDGGRYRPVLPHANGGVESVVLPGYEWVQLGHTLRLRERATGALVPTFTEQRDAAQAERDTVLAERNAAQAERDAAQAEVRALRAELARRRT